MKKTISLLLVLAFLLSNSMSVFASGLTNLNSNDIASNKIINELNKIQNLEDQNKIKQLINTPIYGDSYENKVTPTNETDITINAIQNLSQFSGNELDQQIGKLLKNVIDSKTNDKYVSFSKDALVLVKQYCPTELVNIESRVAQKEIQIQIAPPMAMSYANSTYIKPKSYTWSNIFNVVLYRLTLTIHWATNSNNAMSYCHVDSRSYYEAQGITLFMTWCSGNYVNMYTTYAKIYQEAYYLRADGAPVYPAITVTVNNTGGISSTGNNVM
jgi:hypothetical protein